VINIHKKTRRKEIGKYIVPDPEICHRKMTFKGTRIPVKTVLTFLPKGESIEALLDDGPELSREATEEALVFAAEARTIHYQPPLQKKLLCKKAFRRGLERALKEAKSDRSRKVKSFYKLIT
jgi:uncharacterized protein (DUF433 family)